jgi:hypothetical protein
MAGEGSSRAVAQGSSKLSVRAGEKRAVFVAWCLLQREEWQADRDSAQVQAFFAEREVRSTWEVCQLKTLVQLSA